MGPDGGHFVVFRETGCRPAVVPGRSAGGDTERVVLRAWFRLPWLGPPGSRRQRLFRRLCVVTIPLFSGLDGYRTKLWLQEVDGTRYLGIYEWMGEEGGRRYLEALEPLLITLSSRGSVGTELITDREIADVVGTRRVRRQAAEIVVG